jgi:hypothetical protein
VVQVNFLLCSLKCGIWEEAFVSAKYCYCMVVPVFLHVKRVNDGDPFGNWRTFLTKFDMFSNYRNCLFQWRVRNMQREVISWQKGSA